MQEMSVGRYSADKDECGGEMSSSIVGDSVEHRS